MSKRPFASSNLPLSKGSLRVESPEGETFRDFFFRFARRKEAKTGWRSGRLDRSDTKRPDQTRLEKPFMSLFDAMKEAGFAESIGEAELVLQALALEESESMGVRRQAGGLRYWVTTHISDTDF